MKNKKVPVHYRVEERSMVLKPDPVYYGGKKIESEVLMIKDSEEELWLRLSRVFKEYNTSYTEIISEITWGNIKANIVAGEVYFNRKELDKCLARK